MSTMLLAGILAVLIGGPGGLFRLLRLYFIVIVALVAFCAAIDGSVRQDIWATFFGGPFA